MAFPNLVSCPRNNYYCQIPLLLPPHTHTNLRRNHLREKNILNVIYFTLLVSFQLPCLFEQFLSHALICGFFIWFFLPVCGYFPSLFAWTSLRTWSNTHEWFLLMRMQSPTSKSPGKKKKNYLKEQNRKKKTPSIPQFVYIINLSWEVSLIPMSAVTRSTTVRNQHLNDNGCLRITAGEWI